MKKNLWYWIFIKKKNSSEVGRETDKMLKYSSLFLILRIVFSHVE